MKYKNFIKSVRERAILESDPEAEKVIQATLEVLGRRLTAGDADDLAVQLPSEIGHFLIQESPSEKFGLKEFLERVSEKTGCGPETAEIQVRAVTSSIAECVSAEEIQDIYSQLPFEFHSFFQTRERKPIAW